MTSQHSHSKKQDTFEQPRQLMPCEIESLQHEMQLDMEMMNQHLKTSGLQKRLDRIVD